MPWRALQALLLAGPLLAAAHAPSDKWQVGVHSRQNYDAAPEAAEERRLADAEWTPLTASSSSGLRIHVYHAQLEKDVPAEAFRYLTEDVLAAVTRWLSTALRVRPVVGNLFLDQRTGGWKCGDMTVPVAHFGGYEGIPDADFVLYVRASDDDVCSGGPTLGYAASCHMDQFDRPIAGYLTFCKNRVTDAEVDWDSDVAVTTHEITHALGFSSHLFPFFRKDDGTPRTPRDRWGLPPYAGGKYIAAATTIELQVIDGSLKHFVTLPRVVDAARQHYGCETLRRVPLEEAGGDGSAFSHWDGREFYSELMTPVISDFVRYSRVTLALFEDSGWYLPDYSTAGPFHFGADKGCAFVDNDCISGGVSSFPDTFCTSEDVRLCSSSTAGGVAGCTHDLLGRALCVMCRHAAPLPSHFQHFTDPTLGGDRLYMGYCPIWSPYVGTPFCRDEQARDHTVWGESFGEASRCVMSNVVKTGYVPVSTQSGSCHAVRCEGSEVRIRVGEGAGEVWVTCRAEDEGQRLSVSGWRGEITCPSHRVICGTVDDQGPAGVPCLFPAVLRQGRCVCSAGYINADCSVRDTAALRPGYPWGLGYPALELQLQQGVAMAAPARPSLVTSIPGLTYTASPVLPEGLLLDASDGSLSGTPTVASARTAYTIRAADASGKATTAPLMIYVGCDPTSADCTLTTTVTATSTTTAETTTQAGGGSVTAPSGSDDPDLSRKLLVVLANLTRAEIQAELGLEAFAAAFDAALSEAAGVAVKVTAAYPASTGSRIHLELCVLGCEADSATFLAGSARLVAALGDEASVLRLSSVGRRYLPNVQVYQATSKGGTAWTLSRIFPSASGGGGASSGLADSDEFSFENITDSWYKIAIVALLAATAAFVPWWLAMKLWRCCRRSFATGRPVVRGPHAGGQGIPPQVMGQRGRVSAPFGLSNPSGRPLPEWQTQPTPFAAEALREAGVDFPQSPLRPTRVVASTSPGSAAPSPSQPRRPSTAEENAKVGQLIDMGFDVEAAHEALRANRWSLERAIEALSIERAAEPGNRITE